MEPRHPNASVSRPMGPMPGRLGVPHGMTGQVQPRTGVPPGQGAGASVSSAGAVCGEHGYPVGGMQQRGGQMHVDAAGGAGAGTGGGGGAAGPAGGGGGVDGALKQLAQANEKAWGTLGGVSRAMENEGQATECYERALVHNPYSPSALAGLGGVYKSRGDYRKVWWIFCTNTTTAVLRRWGKKT